MIGPIDSQDFDMNRWLRTNKKEWSRFYKYNWNIFVDEKNQIYDMTVMAEVKPGAKVKLFSL